MKTLLNEKINIMKKQFLLKLSLVAMIMAIAVSCTPPPDPKPPSEQKMKYLSKIISAGRDPATNYFFESCTWDEKGRLKTFMHRHSYEAPDLIFFYDSLDRVCRINYNDRIYGYGYYLCYWKNEKELDSVNFYNARGAFPYPVHDSLSVLVVRYLYTYDSHQRCTQITKIFAVNSGTSVFSLEWDGENIAKFEPSGDISSIIQGPYDDKYSIYSAFPKFPLMFYSTMAYNPSYNNSLMNCSYDYDEDGYPIRMYTFENGKIEAVMDIIYEQLYLN